MRVRTFRTEFAVSLQSQLGDCELEAATNLGKVLAHVISRAREIMTERAGIPGLARTLAEELARHMRRICMGQQESYIRIRTALD